jgi:Uri superfamily endonuclease
MPTNPSPPSPKGTYIFLSYLDSASDIQMNKKGRTCHFSVGWYAYVGSAFGPGGLKARLNRHYAGSGKAHWNIDFFRRGVRPCRQAWVSYEQCKLESLWAAVLQRMPGVSVPVVNFGNADARGEPVSHGIATTHLFHLQKRPSLKAFQKQLERHREIKGAAPHKVMLPM